jgi:hypothetical protein
MSYNKQGLHVWVNPVLRSGRLVILVVSKHCCRNIIPAAGLVDSIRRRRCGCCCEPIYQEPYVLS